MNYNRRLSALAHQLGCPVHGSPLSCPVCDPPEPMPEPLTTAAGDFINAILARVGREGLRAAALQVTPPPVHDTCPRCGTRRQCGACQVRHTKALLREIQLTSDEQATLETILATCRRMEREGRR